MRILIITDLFPIMDDEKHTPKTIKAFADSWEKLGHEVRVIKPNFLLNSFIRKKPYYKSGFYGNVENINYLLPFMGDIKKKIKTLYAPDVVVAHMPCGLIFANKLGLNFCAAVHMSDIEVLTNPLYKKYFKPELESAYQNAKKIACRSYALKERFLSLYPQYRNKTFVAPSGIDYKLIQKRDWKDRKKLRVLTCGQFIERKNIDKVISACEKFENVELSVIGSGKLEKELKKDVKNAFFMGQLPHYQVLEKMTHSDVFILPSVNETFGMVYLEAMARGCITVCRKGDGIDGIIQDGINGFLCEDVEDVIKKILECEYKQRVLDMSFQTISNLTEEIVAENYLKCILGF